MTCRRAEPAADKHQKISERRIHALNTSTFAEHTASSRANGNHLFIAAPVVILRVRLEGVLLRAAPRRSHWPERSRAGGQVDSTTKRFNAQSYPSVTNFA